MSLIDVVNPSFRCCHDSPYLNCYGYGKVATKVDAKNQKIAYTYDSLARLTQIDHYSAAGNSQPDAYGTVTITYDAAVIGS